MSLFRVGGPIDEVGVGLAVYGEDLDPVAVTELLGCPPTWAYRRGDVRGPRSPPLKRGVWMLEERCAAPRQLEELAAHFLDRLPQDQSTWARLRERYEVKLRFSIRVKRWNRGFEISAALASRISGLGIPLGFEIWHDQLDVDVAEGPENIPEDKGR